MNLFQRISVTATLAAAFFSIPALAQKVETDYDHSAHFSEYHTYSWGQVHATDPLFEGRIRDAVDRDLQSKGWQQVPSGGDATLTAVTVRKDQAEYNTFYNGLGPGWGWRGWGGGGMATTMVEHVPIGTLVVDIYETPCVARHGARPAFRQAGEEHPKARKAVDKLFDKFPPTSS